MNKVPCLTLNNGVSIPQLGYGVFEVPPEEAQGAVEAALGVGYRHIDTAAAYYNEAGVGAAIRASGIRREDIFVTTKLRNGDQGFEQTLSAFASSNRALGLDFVDLYLIHWPVPTQDRYIPSWKALEKLYDEGAVRAIGVSNFLRPHLDRLLSTADVVPAVNQIEVHPTFQQDDLTRHVGMFGVAVEAYSPLGRGADLRSSAVLDLARRHGVSPAQIILRWHVQRGGIAIPKSVRLDRMRANFDIFNFELTNEDLRLLSSLEGGVRVGGDPSIFDRSQIR